MQLECPPLGVPYTAWLARLSCRPTITCSKHSLCYTPKRRRCKHTCRATHPTWDIPPTNLTESHFLPPPHSTTVAKVEHVFSTVVWFSGRGARTTLRNDSHAPTVVVLYSIIMHTRNTTNEPLAAAMTSNYHVPWLNSK